MREILILVSSAALLTACSSPDTGSNSDAGKSGEDASTTAPATATAKAPRAGLWEQTTSGGMIPAPVTLKMCIGEPEPGADPYSMPQAEGADCTQSAAPTIGGMAFTSTCQVQGMTIVSNGKMSGDMNSAYKVEITSRTTGPNVPPQMAEISMVIDAKRLGDCPAGVQPGSPVQ